LLLAKWRDPLPWATYRFGGGLSEIHPAADLRSTLLPPMPSRRWSACRSSGPPPWASPRRGNGQEANPTGTIVIAGKNPGHLREGEWPGGEGERALGV